MRASVIVTALLSAGLVTGAALLAVGQPAPQGAAGRNELRPVSSFAGVKDGRARSIAMFEEAGKVMLHPRCVNCHPATERPTQTDRMQPHQPLVVRGKDGHGAPGMACSTCHGKTNYDPAGGPGHPDWHLAPESMAWQGRSLAQICAQIKDPKRNGGKTMAELVHHMAEDPLVGWGWSPGAGREPAPGSQAEFGALIKAWADTGGHCPAS
jgi:hypothetical protein